VTGLCLRSKPGGTSWDLERLNGYATDLPVAIAKGNRLPDGQFGDCDLREGLSDREESRFSPEDALHRSGGVQLESTGFTEEDDAQGMIQLGISGYNSLYWDVASSPRN
jgi:hypothetical protein